MFSAKESVFKAVFSITGEWLRFDDVVLTIEPSRGSFEARVFPDRPLSRRATIGIIHGRFAVEQRLVFTVATVPNAVLVA
jgi:4'-phosphopantetheinyl transferase EntD